MICDSPNLAQFLKTDVMQIETRPYAACLCFLELSLTLQLEMKHRLL